MKAPTPTHGHCVVVPCPVGPGFEVHQQDGDYICDVESRPLADLIAAAPDLLAAARELLEQVAIPRGSERVSLEKAIAKARGA